jgi:hypothetical protein
MKQKMVDNIIGWCGAVLLLIAYALVNFNYLSTSSLTYIFLNLIGAFGIAYISFKDKAYQPGVVNVAWAVIALIALIRLLI